MLLRYSNEKKLPISTLGLSLRSARPPEGLPMELSRRGVVIFSLGHRLEAETGVFVKLYACSLSCKCDSFPPIGTHADKHVKRSFARTFPHRAAPLRTCTASFDELLFGRIMGPSCCG